MKTNLDIVGTKVGKLLVQEEVAPRIYPSGSIARRYLCLCDCGTIKEIARSSLLRGLSKSCGCSKVERLTKHGKCKTKEYHTWQSMKNRCYNINNSYYADYGGRGIIVCSKWLDSFDAFLKDVGKAPSKKASLDRIDTNYNYTPDNVRWIVNQSIQAINKRKQKRNKSGYTGVRKHDQVDKWVAYININKKLTYLGLFDNKEDAIKARQDAEDIYYKPLLASK